MSVCICICTCVFIPTPHHTVMWCRLEDICAVAGDTKGPEIRTGLFDPAATNGETTIPLQKGQRLVLVTDASLREEGATMYTIPHVYMCDIRYVVCTDMDVYCRPHVVRKICMYVHRDVYTTYVHTQGHRRGFLWITASCPRSCSRGRPCSWMMV